MLFKWVLFLRGDSQSDSSSVTLGVDSLKRIWGKFGASWEVSWEITIAQGGGGKHGAERFFWWRNVSGKWGLGCCN